MTTHFYTFSLIGKEVTVEAINVEEAEELAAEELANDIQLSLEYDTEPDYICEETGCNCNNYGEENGEDDYNKDPEWNWDNDACHYVCGGYGDTA